jgi:hypothetical protein
MQDTSSFCPFLRPRSPRIVLFVVIALFLSLLLSVVAHGAEFDFMGTRIDRDFEIKGLMIPLQVSSTSSQNLQITCARVGLESKKVGLFRIGPMPQLVIEDMAVILPDGIDLALCSSALDAFFQANPAWSEIIIRHFEVRQSAATKALFRSQQARIDAAQGKIFLEKFLVSQTNDVVITSQRAVLILRGNFAGQVFRIRGRSDDSVKIFP